MKEEKRDILTLSLDDIKKFLESNNEKAFRAAQVYEWLWKKHCRSFDEMSNISKPLRDILNTEFFIQAVKPENLQISKDKTIKLAFRLFDNSLVEGVLIPSEDRSTACISSQVGCNLGCEFCATGKLGLKRNLSAGEIYHQVVEIMKLAKDKYDLSLTNIVLMGMGEPLLNYDNVLKAMEMISSDKGLGMSPQRITLSTVGLPRMIKRLADDNIKFNLAISLHSANEKKRSDFMPVNNHNSLESLKEALIYFNKKTGQRITFEYLLLNGINDSLADAKDLAEYCKSFPVKINIIEYNTTGNPRFNKSMPRVTDAFVTFLKSKNMVVNVRRSRGQDIDAACGQLAAKKGK
ncbi:MAG: 23S rRNA (adenine(2503)-C(2))-methyltransferase [Bacteroidetes bacterium GWC2_33_15]|nr:MAG: 23S rRNA (adenine(2503)-C(2))-methyltransferase [Bacteroidetes bacterium GWA2_33_15]OFX49409.1 MAG: 23S rRNA (adenine(2503)-C(2))-methyltransferase [Bacteroidetes bacterium GWC2_33_15]OFX62998.1 MAG: 23S rRNA (adenine(2503)-C(2))-methyltransferase [Bacteroidetes bacterium GWB2_32_14]OFX68757.1 MAG: 23S rRNA (adenine(2503)-C(2))-methyltransferase [Bacteroidetes bacterium GWD2_33_33]HAN19068.1 23S rRNA (adenine(2503)-C(2))-methyltransferase RlmN [Bacteroidales bacterium]